MKNSLINATVQTIIALLVCSLAGYALSYIMTRQRISCSQFYFLHDDSAGSYTYSSVQDDVKARLYKYGMGLHAPGYFNAVPHHDVQTEFEKLPNRYNGGGTN